MKKEIFEIEKKINIKIKEIDLEKQRSHEKAICIGNIHIATFGTDFEYNGYPNLKYSVDSFFFKLDKEIFTKIGTIEEAREKAYMLSEYFLKDLTK